VYIKSNSGKGRCPTLSCASVNPFVTRTSTKSQHEYTVYEHVCNRERYRWAKPPLPLQHLLMAWRVRNHRLLQDIRGFRDETMGRDRVRLPQELEQRTWFRSVAANVGHSPLWHRPAMNHSCNDSQLYSAHATHLRLHLVSALSYDTLKRRDQLRDRGVYGILLPLFWGGGVEQSPPFLRSLLAYSTSPGWWWMMVGVEAVGGMIGRDNRSTKRKPAPKRHFVHHKSYITWPRLYNIREGNENNRQIVQEY
jgi:hypothetical protein